MNRFALLLLLGICCSCESPAPNYRKLYRMPTLGERGINMVVEIPAGTNQKIEFNTATRTFEVDQIDGKDRVINFLPYPGNYGFIPSTRMDEAKGGDGDALDVLVLSESLATGTTLEVHPIGLLILKDDGEVDSKIIATPVEANLRIIEAKNFVDLMTEYDVAKRMLQGWFLNYKGMGKVELIGWGDERRAIEEIKKWMMNN